jgi:hypothetical protein
MNHCQFKDFRDLVNHKESPCRLLYGYMHTTSCHAKITSKKALDETSNFDKAST